MKIYPKENIRLDIFMSNELNQSRSQIQNFIKKIGVRVNDKEIKKPSTALKIDDEVEYEYEPLHVEKILYKVDFDVDILYEDEHLMVINKPPHVVVHAAPSVKEATLVDWLKKRGVTLSTISGEERCGIVHRIDKQTSGALVIAKNNEAHIKLSEQLSDKTMGRYYLALIDCPLKEDIIIQKPIARNSKNRLKMAVVEGGRDAKSAFAKLTCSERKNIELIACKLYTGRTHQIRVHLNSISRHILGDCLYGFKSKKDTIPRVMLHAYIIYFIHPITGSKVKIKAPLHVDMNELINNNFKGAVIDEKTSSDYIFSIFS